MVRARALLAGLATVVLAGCFTTAADFKSDAEDFIRREVATELGVEFTSVTCVEPVNQDVGTRFACTAQDANGGNWEFDNEIYETNRFEVNVSRRP